MFPSDACPQGLGEESGGVVPRAATRSPRWAAWAFLVATVVYLYLIFFVLPHTPIYRGGDGDLYFASATRLFAGEVMYRDFNQFTFPGTEVLYVALFKLFGPTPWIINFSLVGVGLGLSWITLTISRKLIQGWAAFVPALLFLTVVFPSMLDGTHHWFSVMAAMLAVAVVLERRTPGRLAWAGMLCGLAAWFTHMRGFQAVMGIAVFLGWDWQQRKVGSRWLLRRLACLWLSFLAAVLALNAYFIWQAGVGRFLHSTIIFGIKYYNCEPDNSWGMYMAEFPRLAPWPGLSSFLTNLFIHLLVPYAYLLFQIYYRRTVKLLAGPPWDRLMVLQAVGICLFIGVAPAAEWQRLATAALPATILLVWMLDSWGKVGRGLLGGFAIIALAYAIAFPARMQIRRWTYLDLPAGRVALSDTSRLEVYEWVLGHTKPGDFFFDNARMHHFVYLAGLRCPGPVLFLTLTDYTRPEQVRKLIEALEKDRVRLILWEASFEIPSDDGFKGDHLEPLRSYLRGHYCVVKTFPGLDQIWERNDPAVR